MSDVSPARPINEVLADLDAIAKKYPGLKPDVAVKYLMGSPNMLARRYAACLEQAAIELERAIDAVREMERAEDHLRILRGGRS